MNKFIKTGKILSGVTIAIGALIIIGVIGEIETSTVDFIDSLIKSTLGFGVIFFGSVFYSIFKGLE